MRTLLFLLLPVSLLAQTTNRVLFIGNSYTAVNNLPDLTAQVAAANGDTVIYDSNAPGGYTFQMQSTDATTLSKIAQGNWDVVVLQEQSQLPSFSPGQVASQVMPFATRLDSLVKAANACTETMYYMTWGRKYGDASNCAVYPPVCTYEGMQMRLRDSYVQMSTDNNASVSPVGVVWKAVREADTTIELYNPDLSHPSTTGSYLAACTFYASIFHKPVSALNFTAGIDAGDAQLIRNKVDAVVFDSLPQWQDAGTLAFADFEFLVNANSVAFSNQSLNASTYSWDFGDGGNSPLQHPQHTFAAVGSYNVSLTAGNNCNSETVMNTVVISSTSAITTAEASPSRIFFSGKTLVVENNLADAVYLYNVLGEVVFSAVLNAPHQEFQTDSLSNGLYIAVLQKDGHRLSSVKVMR